MNVNKISATKAFKGLREHEVQQPKYVCATCTKCTVGNECQVFQRPVEPNLNKCFFHSNYQPLVVIFRPLKDLDAMIEEEEKRKRLTYA